MKRLLTALIACFALAFAAGAVANVLVYQNSFSKKKDVKRIKKLQGGGKCKGGWKNRKAFAVRVNTGERNCLFRTPVEGDTKEPDYTIQAAMKVTKETNKKVRDKVYAGLALRANRKSGYEIRIFPKGRTFQLIKNGVTIGEDKNKAIKPLDKKNQLRFSVERNVVVAKVNGKRLTKFTDQDVEQVVGRKTALAFGSEARSNKDGFGTIDKVKVFVPSP